MADRLLDPHGGDQAVLGDDDGECPRCGGDGFILASDGDGSDWQEDTYCGPEDAIIKCRVCNGSADDRASR